MKDKFLSTSLRNLPFSGDPDLLPLVLLEGSLDDQLVAIEMVGLMNLVEFVPFLIPKLLDSTFFSSWQTHTAFARLGNGALVPIMEVLQSGDGKLRSAAALALGFIGLAGLNPLLDLMKDKSDRVRCNARLGIHVLGVVSPQVVEALRQCLADKDTENVEHTLEAIRDLEIVELEPETQCLLQHPDEDVRRIACEAMASLKKAEHGRYPSLPGSSVTGGN